MIKEKLTNAILTKNGDEIKKLIKNAPEQESIASIIKDLRDSLGASLELNCKISDWVIENLRGIIAPTISDYYVSSIKKHFLALGRNPKISLEDNNFVFDLSTYEIFKHTFPVDLFSRFFANKFLYNEQFTISPKEEEAELQYRVLVEEYLGIPFFKLLPNIVKIRLVSLDQKMYLSYFHEIIFGVSIRTNVNMMNLFAKEFGQKFLEDVFQNPKYGQLETDVWKADLLASSGRATECYWEDNLIKLTETGFKTLNILYSPFWNVLIDPPTGIDSVFLP